MWCKLCGCNSVIRLRFLGVRTVNRKAAGDVFVTGATDLLWEGIWEVEVDAESTSISDNICKNDH